MSQISLQSERFISLFTQVKPTLEATVKSGPSRTMMMELQPFFAREVLEALNIVKASAELGIKLAGQGSSQVVLSARDLSMLEWALQKAGA